MIYIKYGIIKSYKNRIFKDREIKRIKYFFFKILFFLLIFDIIFSFSINSIYEINMIINGTNNKNILSDSFIYNPSEIIINGKDAICNNKNCNLNDNLNNITIKFNEEIKTCENMFNNLDNIIEIDLSNFDASKVKNMSKMFNECLNIEKINLGKINTSSVQNMYRLFHNCTKLTSIDVSNFDTSSVTNMEAMFAYCHKLITVNVSNFDTSNVISMQGLFYLCYDLKYLDLSSFNTPSLNNIDLSFANDLSLVYINFKSLTIKENTISSSMFFNISENLVICIQDNYSKYKLSELIPSLKINCLHECFNNSNMKVNLQNGRCINNCKESGNKYELNNLCYEICPNTSFLSNYNEYLCLDKSSEDSYYFDNDKNVYKECYKTCKRCNKGGNETNHNCIECNDNYPIKLQKSNYSNCYHCTYYYYFDNYSNHFCTNDNNCPVEYPLLDKRECKISNEKIIEDTIKSINKKDEINYYDTILKNIEDIFTSENYVTSKLDDGVDEIIEIDKLKVILTTSQNQKNNINNNMTIIDLGECEDSLRKNYNLSNNDTLYIKMLEIKEEGMRIPKIEYDIYSKLKGANLTKLDINQCQNNKISILNPVNNVDNIDKLNSSSGYYNDFCYTSTSDSGTDITLNDRKNEYTSIAVCQDDCNFVDYNYTTKKAKCSCQAKKSSNSFADMKINRNKLLDNFKNIKNIINFNLLVCVDVLFSKKGLSKNIGFFIINAIILFHIIALFIFYFKGFDFLKNKIKDIILWINIVNSIKEDKKEEGKYKERIKIQSNEKIIEDNKNKIIINNNFINDNLYNNNKIKDGKLISLKKKGKIITKRKTIKIPKKDSGTFINNKVKINLNRDIIIINNNKINK